MTNPRLTPLRSEPGLIYALRGRLRVAVGRLMVREYRDTAKAVKRRVGPTNGLYGGFAFWLLPCPAGHGRKNSRLRAVGRRTSGGRMAGSIGTRADTLEGLEGTKTAPGLTRGGSCDIQDFFAVSQITINGRRIINRMIKRRSPPLMRFQSCMYSPNNGPQEGNRDLHMCLLCSPR